ncbi:ROK family transcriptional regulator [Aerococcaceae bacterium zg-B36]|uniref:ROK family transcriptional regulator n=1 Tax=Aerococcaceae bacterium zg-252 TaxID=2796928 RepID=UPI001BD8FEEC|nr:ROK family transcriptional regulator [Aerococcaceae bacterium zg-B36]
MITSVFSIRNNNESLVMKTIIENNPISRASVSEMTKLNKASISSIVKTLIDDGLVYETGIGDASSLGGRKPILLEYNSKAGIAIAIDLGHDYLDIVAAYLDGSLIKETKMRNLTIDKDTVLTILEDAILDTMKDLPTVAKGVIGCAISIHGIVQNNKIIFSPIYPIADVPIVEHLSTKFTFPFYLENEANLAALGQYTFISRADDLLCLSIHGGIGLGIIENGELRQGKTGSAGEIGHSILFPNGIACPCGNHGCLERYASQRAIYDSIAEQLNIPIADINSDTLVDLLQGEQREIVLSILEEKAKLLSIAINDIILLNDPEVVYIDSSIYEKIPELVEIIRNQLQSRFTDGVKIKTSNFNGRSSLFGGIAVILRNFFNVPVFKMRNE